MGGLYIDRNLYEAGTLKGVRMVSDLQGAPRTSLLLPPLALLADCFSGLTFLPAFAQLQTFGDLSGVFVAGRTPSNELTVVGSDGMRKPAAGAVSVSVAGHLPSDPRATDGPDAKSASNAVTGSFSM